MKNYLTEFIGTFFLVLTIGLAVISGSTLAPFAIGAALMVMVYMGGHVSGAHYNPAVTLAVWMRGKHPASQIVPYWIAQVAGAIVAAFVVHIMTGRTFAPAPSPMASGFQAVMAEILYTFALALVVLNVATAKQTAGNSYYGLAIGFTVAAGAVAGGPVSGGAFNPAVGVGPIIISAAMGGGGFEHLWLYLVGPFAGGALASIVFKLQHGGSAD
ncbi:MAG TPA: aquaporin [Candidatus Eisenbacteria bacterium]|nr:aquaporin [Candidatus Eisenbacteria bacterium]